MEDRERAVRVLSRLREAGVGVSIDDYGTGYSSLAYLAALPVTELKLDRVFIGAMTGSSRAASIVTSTLQLAHALDLTLVAEGAEDQATVDALGLARLRRRPGLSPEPPPAAGAAVDVASGPPARLPLAVTGGQRV